MFRMAPVSSEWLLQANLPVSAKRRVKLALDEPRWRIAEIYPSITPQFSMPLLVESFKLYMTADHGNSRSQFLKWRNAALASHHPAGGARYFLGIERSDVFTNARKMGLEKEKKEKVQGRKGKERRKNGKKRGRERQE